MASGPDVLASLQVNITGDYSDLSSAIDGATQAAETGAESIAQAFAVPDDATALTASIQAIGEATSAAATDVEGFGSDVGEASGKAADSLDEAGTAATDAAADFDSLGASAEDVGASADGIDELSSSTEEAGESAEEAEGLFGGFVEEVQELGSLSGILELAGISVGVEAIKELGEESITAFADVQKAEVALTAMDGSAEQAAETIEGLKDLALETGQNFESLVAATQSMTAKFNDTNVSAEQIQQTLLSAANAAAATGNSFDQISSSLQRMAVSGTAGARQLATLGLSLQNLADVMGVSTDEVAKDFKQLDPSAALDVLNTALNKYAGQAQIFSQTLAGQWQDLKSTTEFTFEEIGAAIAPAASAILSFAQNYVVPATKDVVVAVADMASESVTSFTTFVSSLEELESEVSGPAVQAFSSLAEAMGLVSSPADLIAQAKAFAPDFWQSFVQNVLPGISALDTLSVTIQTVTGKIPGMTEAMDQLNQKLMPGPPALNALGQAAADAAGNLIQLGTGSTDLLSKQTDLDNEVERATAVYNNLKNAFDQGLTSYNGLAITAEAVARAHNDMVAAINAANPALTTIRGSVDSLSASFQKAQTSFQNAVTEFQSIQTAFANGTASVGLFLEAYSKVESAAKSAGQSFTDVDAAVTKLNQDALTQVNGLVTLTEEYGKLADAGSTTVAGQLAINNSFNALATAAQKLGIQITQTGDAINVSVAAAAAQANPALQGLANTLKTMLGVVDPLTVSVNGQLVPVLQQAGDAASTATSAAGGFSSSLQKVTDAAGDAAGAIQVIKGSSDSATQATNDLTDAQEALLKAFKDVDQGAADAAQAVNQLADAEETATEDADQFGQVAESMGKGGGGGSGGGYSAQSVLSMILAAGSLTGTAEGAGYGTLSSAAQALGLIQLGNTSFETQDQYNQQIEADAKQLGLTTQTLSNGLEILLPAVTSTTQAATSASTALTSVATASTSTTSALTDLATTTSSTMTAQTALAEANAALGTNYSDVSDALLAIQDAISGDPAANLTGALSQIEGDLINASGGLTQMAAQSTATTTSLSTLGTATDTVAAATTSIANATTSIATASTTAAETIGIMAASASDFTTVATKAAATLTASIGGPLSVPTLSTLTPAQVAADSSTYLFGVNGGASANTLGLGGGGNVTLNTNINVTGIVGSTAQQLATLVQQQTVQILKQAGNKL